jgi:hypothetical protein
MLARSILAAALALGLSSAAQAQQQWPGVTLYDSKGAVIGTAANPLSVTGGTGGGGSANAATSSNATDGQATSTTNQQNLVFNMLFNGTTWDRMRGVGGAANVIVTNTPTVSVGNFPASQPVTNAGTFAVQNNAATPTGGNVIGFTTLRSAGTGRSATVSTTASTLMPANTARQGWKLKNDCTVAVWINFDATATAAAGSGNIQIPAGAYMASEPGFIETGAMSAIATSGTCALTAREH